MWTLKTVIASVEKLEKNERKSGRRIVKRVTQALDNGPVDGRIICSFGKNTVLSEATVIRGKGVVNFSTKPPFSFLLFFFRSFPLPAVSLERIIPRYELGIYNYTGAVIGFPSFFLPSFSPTLSPSFFGKHRSVSRFSLYRKAD